MAETINRGPNASIGSLEDTRVELLDGPALVYQGESFPDPRFSPLAKDGLAPGRVPAYFMSPNVVIVDAIPSNTSTTSIAAAQAPSTTVGVALTLVTSVLGTAANVPVFTPGIPIIPTNTTVPVTVSAIDFGFATGTTAANSSTVVVTDNTIFGVGQWLVIGGAGAAGVTNKALITQIQSVSGANTTTIFISPVAATAGNNLTIGQGNFYGNLAPMGGQLGQAAPASASAAEPYQVAGFAKMFDPRQGVARSVIVTSPTTAGGTTTLLVTGFDVYSTPMTELISVVAGTTTPTSGNKAFKYISTITVGAAGTTGTVPNLSVGAGDLIGFNLRNNKWEYLDIFYNGAFTVNNTGWTSAFNGVSTNTTGDVRGTQNMSTAATGTTTGGTLNGVKRVTIVSAPEQVNMLQATPLSTKSLFGVPQA